MKYRTKDGDMLDRICWEYYGQQAGAVEAVLEANPGLGDKGPVFIAGLEITLPDLAPAANETTIRLWD